MDRPVDCHIERRATRMVAMLERMNVDKSQIVRLGSGTVIASARQRCLGCTEVRECLAWLDGRRPGCDPCEFCPNASLFAAHQKTAEVDYQI